MHARPTGQDRREAEGGWLFPAPVALLSLVHVAPLSPVRAGMSPSLPVRHRALLRQGLQFLRRVHRVGRLSWLVLRRRGRPWVRQ